jgi:hypothetical protein
MTTVAPAQNYDNHRKFLPGFHGVAFGILAINFFHSLYVVITAFSVASVIALVLAFGLIMVMFYARLFALGAQDRVIRLEERLRLQALVPPEQKDMINTLTTEQLIGLRFASDGEVGALVATVFAEGIDNREEIKKRVTNWRPDHQRL